MYKLLNNFAHVPKFAVTIVGCGGTGGFAAEGLCRILPPNATIFLIDHDRVELHNIGRQNFTYDDLGKFKSEALALRLTREYKRVIAYTTKPVAFSSIPLPGLIIGCVDNGLARKDIADRIGDKMCREHFPVSWWIDSGNGNDYGQIIIGNSSMGSGFNSETEVCIGFFLPTIQLPQLLQEAPAQQVGCAEMPEQGPTINQFMAMHIVEIVRRMIEGTCTWIQVYVDLARGSSHCIDISMEWASRLTGDKPKKWR